MVDQGTQKVVRQRRLRARRRGARRQAARHRPAEPRRIGGLLPCDERGGVEGDLRLRAAARRRRRLRAGGRPARGARSRTSRRRRRSSAGRCSASTTGRSCTPSARRSRSGAGSGAPPRRPSTVTTSRASPSGRRSWLHRRIDVDFNGWWMCLIPTEVDQGDRPVAADVHQVGRRRVRSAGGRGRLPDRDPAGRRGLARPVDREGRHPGLAGVLPPAQPARLRRCCTRRTRAAAGWCSRASRTTSSAWWRCSTAPARSILTGAPGRARRPGADAPRHVAPARARSGAARGVHRRAAPSRPRRVPAAAAEEATARGKGVPMPTSTVGQVKMAGIGLLRQVLPLRELAAEYPEGDVPHVDQRWWRLAHFDSAVVSSADGAAASWYRRDPQEFRDADPRAAALHAAALPGVAASSPRRYREALPELTSPEAWKRDVRGARGRRRVIRVPVEHAVDPSGSRRAAGPPSANGGLLDVFRRRYLLKLLVRKEIQARYSGSFLGLFWSYVQPAVRFAMYFFVIGVDPRAAQGRRDTSASTCSPGMVFVHYFTRDLQGRHPVDRAQQGDHPEDGDAAGDVPGGLDAGLGLPRDPGDGDPRPSPASSSGGRRTRPASAPGCSGFAIVARARHGAGAAVQRRERVLPRLPQHRQHADDVRDVLGADDLPLQHGRGALRRASRSCYLLNPIAEAVLLMQRCFWVGATVGPGRDHRERHARPPVRARLRAPRRRRSSCSPSRSWSSAGCENKFAERL